MEELCSYDTEYSDDYNNYTFTPELDSDGKCGLIGSLVGECFYCTKSRPECFVVNNNSTITDTKIPDQFDQNINTVCDNKPDDFDFDDNNVRSDDDFDLNDNNNDADNNAGDFDYYSTVDKKEFSKSSFKSVAKRSKADLTSFLVREAQKQPITPRPKLRKRGVQTNIDIIKNDGNWIELLSDAIEKPVFKSAIKDQLIEVTSTYENISLIFAPRILVENFRRYRNGAQNRVQEVLF